MLNPWDFLAIWENLVDMSILELNIHAWEQGQVTNVTKFMVAFFLSKIFLVYFTKNMKYLVKLLENTNNVN